MKNVRITLFVSLLVACVCGCNGGSQESLLPEDVDLMAGDVVLRRGSGVTSRVVLFADRGGSYSHVGIVVDSAGVMMVCHAVPGEPDFDGDPDRVKLERPEAFFSGMRTDNGCVMRYGDADVARRAAEVALAAYRRGTLFDHDYCETDTTEMYCCELVEYAYRRAGGSVATGERHDFFAPGAHYEAIMLPSDFRESSQLVLVREF